MKKVLLAVAGVIFAIGPIAFVLAQQGKVFRVTAVAPVDATSITTHTAYVIGVDAKMRTCPSDAGVYIRPEGKNKGPNFILVPDGQTVVPQDGTSYTIACLVVKAQ